tara:strand:- start:1147 stop:1527 length:381 start_codon:yes stop_codon:yes gene_type:complete
MILTDIIFFLALSFILVCLFSYAFWQMNLKIKELKIKIMRNNILLKSINKNLAALESGMTTQMAELAAQHKNQSRKASSLAQDDILTGYTRAKGLVQRGMQLDESTMKSCSLTKEELELLAETFTD